MSLPGRLDAGLIAGVLSFSLAIIFVPWWSGAADSPRWALVAVASTAALWCRPQWRIEHGLLAALIAFSALSLLWSEGPYEGVDALAKLGFFVGFFVIGGALPNLRPVYIGLGLGLAINSGIVIAQWCGWQAIPQLGTGAGLFMNKNYGAEATALALVALAATPRLWWLALPLLPCLALSSAKSAITGVLAAAIVWIWQKSRLLATGIVVATLACGAVLYERGYDRSAQSERLLIYRSTVAGMTWAGNGIGSFFARFPSHAPRFDTLNERPAHAHNDFLEMLYELGPGALLYFAVIALALIGPVGVEKFVLVAFLTEGMFDFPLHYPIPATLAALVAGRLCRLRSPLRCGALLCGTGILARLASFRPARSGAGGDRPIQARFPV